MRRVVLGVLTAAALCGLAVPATAGSSATPLQQAEVLSADASALQAQAAALQAKAATVQSEAAALVASLKEPPPKEEPPKEPPKEEPPPAATWHGFEAKNPMPASQSPYATSGWVNQRITNPVVLSNSGELVTGLGAWQELWSDGGYDRPADYASIKDPVLEVSCTQYNTKKVSEGGINGALIHVPEKAQASPLTDKHLAIIQPNGVEDDFWETTQIGNGKLVAKGCGLANMETGSGTDSYGGATASGFANQAGTIRSEEWAAGEIHHELVGPVHETKAGCHVGPATGTDGRSSSSTAPCQGQLFQLNMTDAEIAAAPWPREVKTIAYTLAHFGYRVGDSGGSGTTLKLWAPQSYTAFGLPNPFNVFLKELVSEGGITVETGGGGQSYTINVGKYIPMSRMRAIH